MPTATSTKDKFGSIPWPPSPLAIGVIGAKPGASVEIVPGKTYVSLDPTHVETIAVTELVPAGGGTWRAVVRVCPRKFTLTPKNLKRLGIAISTRGLERLIDAGFVKGEAVTPGVTQFDYFDYLRHEQAVAADTEFWDRVDPSQPGGARLSNRERYRQAI